MNVMKLSRLLFSPVGGELAHQLGDIDLNSAVSFENEKPRQRTNLAEGDEDSDSDSCRDDESDDSEVEVRIAPLSSSSNNNSASKMGRRKGEKKTKWLKSEVSLSMTAILMMNFG